MSEENPNRNDGKQNTPNDRRLPRRNLQARPGFPPPPPPGFRGGFPGHFPPPPPGHFPPPPPGYPGGFPHHPQDEYEEYEEVEYVEEYEDEDSPAGKEEIYEEVEEEQESDGSEFQPQYDDDDTPRGRDLTAGGGDVSFQNIQKEGHAKAVQLEKAESVSRRRALFVKAFAVLVFISALVAAMTFVVSLVSSPDEAEKVALNVNEDAWQLSDDTANLVVKNFYRKIGGIEKMSKIKNRLLDGTISYGDDPMRNFYCIEKNGQTYIRIGDNDIESVYFINADGKGKKLKTTSHIGPFDPVNSRLGEALVNAVLYDELLGYAAFNQTASIRSPFREVGSRRIGDNYYEAISLNVGENMDIFCFDKITNLLMYRIIDRNGMSIRVEYSDFKEYPEGYTYPVTRKVYIDDVLAATCKVRQMAVNPDIMFPR